MRFTCPMAVLGLAAAATAQFLTVPENLNTYNSGTSAAVWRTTAGTVQLLYDQSHFLNAGVTGPITINRLRFRGSDAVVNPGGQTYTNATVRLGYAATTYTTMATAYATNRGTMGPTGTTNIVLQPLDGKWTSDPLVNIDLTATTPPAVFTYDPTLGQALLIELTFPTAPVPATNMAAQACSNVAATSRARRNAGTIAGPGTLSDFAAIVKLDFVGPGGYSAPSGSWVENLGAPCGNSAQSFYQFWNFIGDSYDLRNGKSLLLTPDNPTAPNFYIVTGGTTPVDLTAASGTPDTGDDGLVSVTPTTPFVFNFPGGSTTTFGAATNGYIWLSANTNGATYPAVAGFLQSDARLAPCWFDHHAGRNLTTHPLSGMYVNEIGTAPNRQVVVTWREIGVYNGGLAFPGYTVDTFQCVIDEASQTVEYRYGAMNGLLGSGTPLVGFSRGGTVATPAVDPGSRDLSLETPFTTKPEVGGVPIVLAPSARPYLGITAPLNLTHTLSGLPATTSIAVVVIDFAAFGPSPALPLGNPGCVQTVVTPNILALTVAPGASWTTPNFTLPLGTSPNAGGWMGAALYTQGITLDVDSGGALSTFASNTIKLQLGLL